MSIQAMKQALVELQRLACDYESHGAVVKLRNAIDELKQQRDAWHEDANISRVSIDMLKGQCNHLECENEKQGALLNSVIVQRDELLAALKRICEADSDIGMWSIASETLTKVKEQK